MASWSKDEDRLLRRFYGAEGVSIEDIAECLERTVASVMHRARKLRLRTGHFWTEAQIDLVRQMFPTHTNAQIAAAVGRTRSAVYQLTHRLGLRRLVRWTKDQSQALEDFIRAKHPLGWTDAEVAAAWNAEHPDLHVSREWVMEVRRRKCGLPHNAYSEHRRQQVAAKTREQLRKAGLPSIAYLRIREFEKFAERQGWPGVKRPRLVQILNLLYEYGPQTRHQIAKRLGLSWNPCKHKPEGFGLRSNGPGGTYTAELLRMGLIVQLGRQVKTGKSNYQRSQLYAIAPGVVRGPISPPPRKSA